MKRLLIAIAATALLAAAQEPRMTRLIFGAEVKGERVTAPVPEADSANNALAVSDAVVKVEKDRVVAEVVVTNPTAAPVVATLMPYGGAFPYGGTSPLTLAFNDPQVKYTGKAFPPEPPAPIRVRFPANSQTVFTASIELKNWAWDASPSVKVRWGFHGLRGALREGATSVTLPAGR